MKKGMIILGFVVAFVFAFMAGSNPALATPVSATPIPAAGWLVGSGLVGLYGLRKMLKK